MNPLRKAYCRIFQTAFRIALPLLPYREPTVLGSVEEAVELLAREGKRRPLIVTDKGIHGLGLIDPLKERLAQAGMAYSVYDETVPNPTIDNVEAARSLYLADGCDAIIAFGGGSSMDCAKAAGARVAKPRQPVSKMRGIIRIRRRLPAAHRRAHHGRHRLGDHAGGRHHRREDALQVPHQ